MSELCESCRNFTADRSYGCDADWHAIDKCFPNAGSSCGSYEPDPFYLERGKDDPNVYMLKRISEIAQQMMELIGELQRLDIEFLPIHKGFPLRVKEEAESGNADG
jgi:hypothetical protein